MAPPLGPATAAAAAAAQAAAHPGVAFAVPARGASVTPRPAAARGAFLFTFPAARGVDGAGIECGRRSLLSPLPGRPLRPFRAAPQPHPAPHAGKGKPRARLCQGAAQKRLRAGVAWWVPGFSRSPRGGGRGYAPWSEHPSLRTRGAPTPVARRATLSRSVPGGAAPGTVSGRPVEGVAL